MEKATFGRRVAQAALAAAVGLGCAGSAAALALADSHAEATVACAAQKAGWKKSGGKWWYAHSGSGYAKGWEKIGGKWYLFDSAGWMKAGWQKVGKKWYYLKASGAMATGWQKVGKEWYWLGSDGAMRTGWQQVGKKWYYLEPSGAMAASKWVGDYYLTSSGAMATNAWVGKYWVGADGRWVKDHRSSETLKPAEPGKLVRGEKYDYFIAENKSDAGWISQNGFAPGAYVLLHSSEKASVPAMIQGHPVVGLSDVYCYSIPGAYQFHTVPAPKIARPDQLKFLQLLSVDPALLDLSKCASLEEFWSGKGKRLDLSNCKSLKELLCDYCGLTSLVLPRASSLEEVYCEGNQLTSLDVSDCPKLKWLHCGDNPFIAETKEDLLTWGEVAGHNLYMDE
ncbi:hypothetical protein GMI69_01925 [Eggerthellaceae bacterium zg-887]|uniref:hypothetical protein n=1 Tax=Xiamenia xianingshaonis TaxID=2682776 RepID=UPI0014078D23|nr:hypothetical protein [Xiamenia xianingshaonis]NHM15431.1 hypothetical protein [Xiamenia xianingshaonis]